MSRYRLGARRLVPAFLALAVLSAVGCSNQPRRPSGGDVATSVPRVSETFASGGKAVRMEVMHARDRGPRPAVIMLHGASGIGSGYLIYPHGAAIAQRGIHVFVVDYYDGLDVGGSRSSPAYFPEREQVILDAIENVRSRPDVDPNRIGIFGLSLGGFHALALGATDPRITAIVDLMGAMPQSIPLNQIDRMPPTLILHGSDDRIVPLRRMTAVASLLDRLRTPYEVKIYMGEGHNLGPDAHADSVTRTAAFFDRYLNRSLLAMVPTR